MGEYDAFGRKKDEDTMSDLGWGATGEAPPPVEVSASPDVSSSTTSASPSADWSPAQPTTVTSMPGGPRRRRSGGFRPIVWLIQLAVLGAVGFGIYLAVDEGRDAVNDVRDTFNETFTSSTSDTRTTPATTDPEGSTPPEQVEARRLFTATGLQDALKVMERDTPGRLQNFTIRPEAIHYQVQRGSKWSIATLNADGEAPDISTTQEREPVDTGIRYGQIDVGAPTRLIRGAGARLNKARNDVDYVIMQEISGVIRWIVYFKGGRYAIGNAQGRVTQVY